MVVLHEMVAGNHSDAALQTGAGGMLQSCGTMEPGQASDYPVWPLHFEDFRPREGTCRTHTPGSGVSRSLSYREYLCVKGYLAQSRL